MKKIICFTVMAAILTFANITNAGDVAKKNWLHKEMSEIQEDYDEAIHKIDRSSFTDEQKKILKSQADSNKNLAETQAKAVNEQLQKNAEARKGFLSDGKSAHKQRKIFKEIDDIL